MGALHDFGRTICRRFWFFFLGFLLCLKQGKCLGVEVVGGAADDLSLLPTALRTFSTLNTPAAPFGTLNRTLLEPLHEPA